VLAADSLVVSRSPAPPVFVLGASACHAVYMHVLVSPGLRAANAVCIESCSDIVSYIIFLASCCFFFLLLLLLLSVCLLVFLFAPFRHFACC
jgi:hypothetical protein